MPKLLVFAACEKVLIDQKNNVSLIALLQDVQVGMPAPDEVSKIPAGTKVLAPMKWDVLTLWRDTDAGGRIYEERVALYDPSGQPTGVEGTTPIDFKGLATVRNIITVFGFPIYQMGVYLLRLWVREKGHADYGEPVAEFPITISRDEPKSAPA